MAQATIGKWGRSLALRIPFGIAKAAQLSEGERVDIEVQEGEIVIRRPAVRARADAEAAAEEIIEESRGVSLDRTTIRELIEEGRRG
jgi:antitoxin MazE